MKEWKIEVKNEEESRLVQEKAFRLGYAWPTVDKRVQLLAKRCLYLWTGGGISYGSGEERFLGNKIPQISVADFLALTEYEPSPKYRTDFRVGDDVTFVLHGKVESITKSSGYSINVVWVEDFSISFCFTLDGKFFTKDKKRTLYHGHITIPESATRTLETEPEIKELTLSEIAEKFGVPVEQLRIKDGEK